MIQVSRFIDFPGMMRVGFIIGCWGALIGGIAFGLIRVLRWSKAPEPAWESGKPYGSEPSAR